MNYLSAEAYGDDPALARDRARRAGEHIAGAALFLASDDARFVTGEALAVDGGLTAAGVDRGTTGLPPVIRKAGR